MKSDLNGTFVFSNHEEEARRMAKILNVNFFVQDGDRKKITRSAVTERKISDFFKCHVKFQETKFWLRNHRGRCFYDHSRERCVFTPQNDFVTAIDLRRVYFWPACARCFWRARVRGLTDWLTREMDWSEVLTLPFCTTPTPANKTSHIRFIQNRFILAFQNCFENGSATSGRCLTTWTVRWQSCPFQPYIYKYNIMHTV